LSKTQYHLTKGKQNTQLDECHIPYTVPSANIFAEQRVYGHRLSVKSLKRMEHAARYSKEAWVRNFDLKIIEK